MSVHFRPMSSVVHEQFGDETVVVNLDSGCYYSLQGAADAIWMLAVAGQSRPQILEAVGTAFSGDGNEIARATDAFLNELVAEALLEQADGDSATAPPDLAGGPFVTPVLQKYADMAELLQLDPIHQVDEFGWPSAKPPTG